MSRFVLFARLTAVFGMQFIQGGHFHMRFLTPALLSLVLATSAAAQSATAQATIPTTLPATVYEQTFSTVDASGNLVVIDYGAYLTSTTVTGRNGTTHTGIARSPKTRITVVRSSKTEVVEYDGRLEVFATGTKALYAVLDTVTTSSTSTTPTVSRSLLAIPTASALPATAAGLPSVSVNSGAALRVASPDTFTVVDAPGTTGRTIQLLTFNGTKFVVTTSASLP